MAERDEFARPPVYDRPAGVAQVAAAVSGKPLPPRPVRTPVNEQESSS